MNYLGHLFLSGPDPAILLGNFIGDFIKPKDLGFLTKEVQLGVEVHRKIDTYTDRHKDFRLGVSRLRSQHQKYAPVVLDILYDHLLALHWNELSDQSLEDFCAWVYQVFEEQQFELPPKTNAQVEGLLKHKYLESYGSIKGLDYVLTRMDKRAHFPSNFIKGRTDLYQNMELFTNEFKRFIIDVKAYCEQEIARE